MSFKSAKNVQLYIAGYDITGEANKMGLELPRTLRDVTTFGQSGHKWKPTLHKDRLKFNGFYDPAGDMVTILNSLRGSSGIISAIVGTAQGDEAICGEGAFEDEYTLDIPVQDVITLSSAFAFDGKAELNAVLLQPKATKTSDGNGTGRDEDSSSSDGGVGYLHVFSCGADDALIVKIQDDDNAGFTSPNDLITFTTANGITSERKTASGTVQRYVRVTWSGTPTYSVSFAVIWKRN